MTYYMVSCFQYDVVPENDRDFVRDLAASLYVFTTNMDQGVLRGFAMVKEGEVCMGRWHSVL